MRRYREIHDLTHVTLGMPINMLGRISFDLNLFWE
jgi:ubiquinone biosynthesis protein Coq4